MIEYNETQFAINQRIKDLIEFLKKTRIIRNQQEFVENLGVDKTVISRIVNQKMEVPYRIIEKIVDTYPVSRQWLLYGEGELDGNFNTFNNYSRKQMIESVIDKCREKYDIDSNVRYCMVSTPKENDTTKQSLYDGKKLSCKVSETEEEFAGLDDLLTVLEKKYKIEPTNDKDPKVKMEKLLRAQENTIENMRENEKKMTDKTERMQGQIQRLITIISTMAKKVKKPSDDWE